MKKVNLTKHKAKIFISAGMILAVVWVLIAAAGCSKKSTQPEQFTYPDSNISFAEHIHPIFIQDCASGSGCHSSGQSAAGLDLQSLTPDFTNDQGLPVVFPNDAENSPLYRVLLGPFNGMPQMPPLTQLPSSKIKAIRIWINEGALIN
ncbi:MAG: c-type cytochrome domain-containing protein [Calditrichia bacterium]